MTADACGSNHGLMNLLKGKNSLSSSGWLADEEVQFSHPCATPPHKIAFFFVVRTTSKILETPYSTAALSFQTSPQKGVLQT